MATTTDPRRRAALTVLARLAGDAVVDDADGPDGAGVVEVRDGAALLLRSGAVLVRSRPGEEVDVARREVRVARALTGASVPVTALATGLAQPVQVGGCVVTLWAWHDAVGRATPAEVGALARTLRERTARLAGGLAPFDPIEAVLREVAHLPADDPDAAYLRDRVGALTETWAEAKASDPLGRAVVHGDLHASNVIAEASGPILTDLELSGDGPASYDVAPAVVAVERYGADPATLDAFLSGYGADPRSWPGFATFTALYELWVTARTVAVRGFDPAWAVEASRRVATLRGDADHTWTIQ